MSEPRKAISRERFVNRYKHELYGLVADAIGRRQAGDGALGLFLEMALLKIDKKLNEAFDLLTQPDTPPIPAADPPAAANGAPKAGAGVKR